MVQGVSLLRPGLLIEANGSIDGIDSRRALSGNTIQLRLHSTGLVSDDFADDEPAWVAEHKCWQPPYLVIHIGPTIDRMQ